MSRYFLPDRAYGSGDTAISDADPMPIAGTFTASVSQVGAAHLATAQGAASTTASTALAARATRRSALIRNLDASITIYAGPATVTTGNGFPILPGESVPFTFIGLIQVIAASGTPAFATADEYD